MAAAFGDSFLAGGAFENITDLSNLRRPGRTEVSGYIPHSLEVVIGVKNQALIDNITIVIEEGPECVAVAVPVGSSGTGTDLVVTGIAAILFLSEAFAGYIDSTAKIPPQFTSTKPLRILLAILNVVHVLAVMLSALNAYAFAASITNFLPDSQAEAISGANTLLFLFFLAGASMFVTRVLLPPSSGWKISANIRTGLYLAIATQAIFGVIFLVVGLDKRRDLPSILTGFCLDVEEDCVLYAYASSVSRWAVIGGMAAVLSAAVSYLISFSKQATFFIPDAPSASSRKIAASASSASSADPTPSTPQNTLTGSEDKPTPPEEPKAETPAAPEAPAEPEPVPETPAETPAETPETPAETPAEPEPAAPEAPAAPETPTDESAS